MPTYLRLQGLKTVSAGASFTAQTESEGWADLGRYRRLTANIQRVVAGSAGSFLVLQTAAVKDASAFVDLMPLVPLSATGNYPVVVDDLLRWVRWRVWHPGTGSNPQFMIDLIARED